MKKKVLFVLIFTLYGPAGAATSTIEAAAPGQFPMRNITLRLVGKENSKKNTVSWESEKRLTCMSVKNIHLKNSNGASILFSDIIKGKPGTKIKGNDAPSGSPVSADFLNDCPEEISGYLLFHRYGKFKPLWTGSVTVPPGARCSAQVPSEIGFGRVGAGNKITRSLGMTLSSNARLSITPGLQNSGWGSLKGPTTDAVRYAINGKKINNGHWEISNEKDWIELIVSGKAAPGEYRGTATVAIQCD